MKHEWPNRLVLLLSALFMIMLNGLPSVSAGNAAEKPLLMATTTSTDNTGLLEYLMPAFIESTGIDIRWISTGTGKALKLGENCDVDVLLVHAPQSEKAFVDKKPTTVVMITQTGLTAIHQYVGILNSALNTSIED